MNMNSRFLPDDALTWQQRLAVMERLIGWIPNGTRGLQQVFADMRSIRAALSSGEQLPHAIAMLADDLERLTPRGAISDLALEHARKAVTSVMLERNSAVGALVRSGSARNSAEHRNEDSLPHR